MEDKSTATQGTWFVTTSNVGKLICCAKESKANVNMKHVEGSVVECTEVYELLDPVQANEVAPGQLTVAKQALATPYSLLSQMSSVHVSLSGAVLVFFADMSKDDQKFHDELLAGPRQLMNGWKKQRAEKYSLVQLANERDLRSIGGPAKP